VFSCRTFESHPGVLLLDHLRHVGESCERLLSNLGISDTRLLKLAALIGKTHDFAKYSPLFQEHLKSCKKCKRRELHSHAPVSALYASWAAHRVFNDPLATAVAMLCVYTHHSNLTSIRHLPKKLKNILGNPNYRKQLEEMSQYLGQLSAELQRLLPMEINAFFECVNKDNLSDVYRALMKAFFSERDYHFSDLYKILLLFSALIDSDKKLAAKIRAVERYELPSDAIERYLGERFASRLGGMVNLRNALRHEAMESLMEIFRGKELPRIMSITAPTGGGKTLLSLSVALKLREEIYKRTGLKPRIIYALPYINIIEQTYNVFSDFLKSQILKTDEAPPINLLLKHHHLYSPEEDKDCEKPIDELLLLTESWESEIIVTTFVQLLETLLGTRNRMLKKFHKLFNAIIILDEVQTLPVEYWKLIREAFEGLVSCSNAYVIFMTATRPSMFEGTYELVKNYDIYFAKLDRVKYEYIDKDMSVDDVADFAVKEWAECPSLMVVVNKISTSIDLYGAIKERLDDYVALSLSNKEYLSDREKPVIAYLSTNLIPRERERRVEALKKLLGKGRRVMLVSTQVVEAGVDLDFCKAIRDIGPFDSIIQVGGRCNREWKRKAGKTYVVRVVGNKTSLDAADIYGSLTIGLAEEILRSKPSFNEREIVGVLNIYYNLVHKRLRVEDRDESVRVLEAIKSLDFDIISEFKLIEEEPKVAVFIEADQEATEVIAKFRDVWSRRKHATDREEQYKLRASLRSLRANMERFIVETYRTEYLPMEVVAEGLDIRYVSLSRLGDYYDGETGLKRGDLQASFW